VWESVDTYPAYRRIHGFHSTVEWRASTALNNLLCCGWWQYVLLNDNALHEQKMLVVQEKMLLPRLAPEAS